MAESTPPSDAQPIPDEGGLFRDLLDAAPDAMLIVDEGGRIVFANARAETLFGYTRDELFGQEVEMLVPAHRRREHQSQREGYRAEPRKRPMGSGLDLQAVRKDGSMLPVEISLSPHRTSRGLLVSAAIRDISHRIDIERELRQARTQAEQASTAKSRFLAAASHDLRQPLQAAILYNNVLGRQLGQGAQAETVGKLQSSLEALRDLLNRLLDVSRLEAGAVAPEVSVLSVRILFERLYDELAPQAQEKELELRIRPGAWRIRSDPQLLEQLLRNLVSNALRYTEHGGVLVGCRRAGTELRIQVWDTGIGIPPSELEAIFDEFYQVSNPARRRQAGLGLGLAIVRGLSQLLGHPVAVRSELGRGSVFEVRVPLAVKHVRTERAILPKPPLRRRAVVGVIDDDAEVLDSLCLSLQQSGHEVLASAEPEEMLRLARRFGRGPDVIVSDYRLGEGVTGAEAIGRLRRELGVAIPGIVITGDSSSAALRELQAAGYPVLHKPVDPDRLEEAIARALAEEHAE
ncbi:MAG TPA: PAS domain S-box protein [Thermoanaerobaculia bacterium]|nr:PAS domain S-box protein [Thermoanaerobaculia bacterium]